MRPLPRPLLPLLALALLSVGAGCNRDPWAGITPEQFARLNEHRIRGTALLENDKKAEAADEFVALQRLRPNLAFGFINEAAAFALAPGPEQTTRALKASERGVSLASKNAWAWLVRAKILVNAARQEEATKAYEKALGLAPNDARVLATFAEHLRSIPGDQSRRLAEVRKQVAALAPANLAAQAYHLESQLDSPDRAAAAGTLAAIRKLLPRPSAEVREAADRAEAALAAGSADAVPETRGFLNLLRGDRNYTPAQTALSGGGQDPAVLLMREWDTPPPVIPHPALAPIRITWKDATAAAGLSGLRPGGVAPVAVGDVELAPDAGRGIGDQRKPLQGKPDFLIGPDGRFFASAGSGPGRTGAPPPPGSPVLADLNNDFSLDCYFAGEAGDTLWANPQSLKEGDAGMQATRRAPAPPRPIPGPRGAGTATVVDLDQDGDLDILRASADPGQPALRYLRNNGNLSFTDLTASAGLSLPSGGARQAVYGDFDLDGDPDVFVVRSDAGCRLFLNQRQDVFRDATEEWGLKAEAGARSAVVGDFDRDGDWDLVVAGAAPHGTILYRNEGGRFTPDAAALPLPAEFGPQWVELLDYDNDTRLDLAFAGRGGVCVVHNDGGRFPSAESIDSGAARWLTWVDHDEDGDVDLLVAGDQGLRLLQNEGGSARPSLRIEFEGEQVHASSMGELGSAANNTYGISSEMEPRTVWDAQKQLVTRPVMHVGLGAAQSAVAVRILWTHGVPQDAIAPATGTLAHFKQIPSGSCPYLYTWDGEQWRFAKDFLWRSPLGMLAGRGRPIPHDLTSDWVKLPGEWLQPAGGYYRIAVTEELREITYFDEVRLLAVDHPEGTGVYVDERFPFGPAPPFRIHTTRRERLPRSARNQTGEDLLPALREEDLKYTPVPAGPYKGVRAPHDLILDLGPVPDPERVHLFLSGWIFPAANSTNVNVAQNPDLPVIPPTLWFGDGKGGWTRPDATVGLPCGKRKTIVLDLGGRFTPGDYRVKLTTTTELRWDRAFFTSGEEPVPLRKVDLPLAEADLQERGIRERYWESADGPDLRRYDRVLEGPRAPAWRPLPGAYTRLGDCAPLLRAVDDRYVIIAPGDEIRLLFDARTLPAPPPGWRRDFVVLSDGWTKDSDPNTVTGETVEPLPFHGMRRYPYGPDESFPDSAAHRRWQREWNTRIRKAGAP
jgi:hypothetical protein